jgi:hypothetical protein
VLYNLSIGILNLNFVGKKGGNMLDWEGKKGAS